MRTSLLIVPLLLGAAVLAQQGPSAEELVARLGHEDYEIREQATKQLIEMGEKALPELEKALQSDDVEVRLRAGRAMRAIRSNKEEGAEQRERVGPSSGELGRERRAGTNVSSTKIEFLDGKVRVTIREAVDGQEKEKVYEGESLEQLKKEHPELADKLGGMRFGFSQGGRDAFDMDKFWEDWGRDWNDDFMRRWREETRRDLERMRRWMQLLEEQRRQQGLPDRGERPAAVPDAHALGVRASRPPEVLDAQLQLRGRGLVVDAVEKDTAADRLGLQRHDILLELNEREIRDARDVARAMRTAEETAPLTATVLRRGQLRELREVKR